MKRALVLLAVPVALGALWWVGERARPSTSAEVEIVTDEVLPLRGTVISRLATIGGVRIAERTDFAGRGDAQLTFRVPAARLEEALVELGEAGGTVRSQEIDLEEASAAATDLNRRISDIEGCLGDAAEATDDPLGARDDLAACRDRLRDVSSSLEVAQPRVDDATLTVRIQAASSSNAILVAGIAMLAVALAVMAFLTLRSARHDRLHDLTDRVDLSDHDDDLHLGRRWN